MGRPVPTLLSLSVVRDGLSSLGFQRSLKRFIGLSAAVDQKSMFSSSVTVTFVVYSSAETIPFHGELDLAMVQAVLCRLRRSIPVTKFVKWSACFVSTCDSRFIANQSNSLESLGSTHRAHFSFFCFKPFYLPEFVMSSFH
jgi:hypothetical protein